MTVLVPHPSTERGHVDHGWLDAHHSFSFARWYEPHHLGIGPLRVLNQDRIEGGTGFGAHGHDNMEIVSIVLSGAIKHEDSSGTHSVIRPGEIQIMSAGIGVVHSEMNHLEDETTELLQIWIRPDENGLPMSYQQVQADPFIGESLPCLVSPEGGERALRIHQDAYLYGGAFANESQASHMIAAGRVGYLHVAKGTAVVNGETYGPGDGAYIVEGGEVEIEGRSDQGYLLLFDLIGQ